MDRLIALLLAGLVCVACWTPVEASPPPRIVSLAPHLTEILFAAGAGARVVGTTEFSDHPEAARAVPRVGDAFTWTSSVSSRSVPTSPCLQTTW